jgi:hypothetical protein
MKPDDLRLLTHQFNLYKLTPESIEFERAAAKIFRQKRILDSDVRAIASMANDYERLSVDKKAIDVSTRLNLFNIFLRADHQQDAEIQLQVLRDIPEAQKKIPGMLLRLSNYLGARNQKSQAERYNEQILEQYPESDAAEQIRVLRNA